MRTCQVKKIQDDHKIKCPRCQSTWIENVAMNLRGNFWKCLSCSTKWFQMNKVDK